MIDVQKIRSLKTLDSIKETLNEFIALEREVAVAVYEEEHGWGEEDYEADLEQVKDLLEQVERRHKSLSGHLARQKTKESKPQKASPVPQA